VGSGPLKKELYLERARLGLAEKVVFGGSLDQEGIRECYITSDVFLFTGVVARNGDRDGIPNVIPEAMSAGCLILSSCFAGASEAFIEDVSGFSLNPFESKEWVHLLSEFWKSPRSFERIRRSAIQYSKDSFHIDRTVASIKSVIEKYCG
jgi:glycosyltransferase involved in cell wall biosynthesis